MPRAVNRSWSLPSSPIHARRVLLQFLFHRERAKIPLAHARRGFRCGWRPNPSSPPPARSVVETPWSSIGRKNFIPRRRERSAREMSPAGYPAHAPCGSGFPLLFVQKILAGAETPAIVLPPHMLHAWRAVSAVRRGPPAHGGNDRAGRAPCPAEARRQFPAACRWASKLLRAAQRPTARAETPKRGDHELEPSPVGAVQRERRPPLAERPSGRDDSRLSSPV